MPDLPVCMRYAPHLISVGEERALLEKVPELPFKEFEFHFGQASYRLFRLAL